MILNVLEDMLDRIGVLAALFGGLLEIGWAVSTAFVVPVLIVDGVGPIEAVKRSAAVLRRRWGETVVGEGSFVVLSMLFVLPAMLLFALLASLTVGTVIYVPISAIFVFCVMAICLVFSVLSVIFRTSLYVYATTGASPAGVDSALVDSAFRRKR